MPQVCIRAPLLLLLALAAVPAHAACDGDGADAAGVTGDPAAASVGDGRVAVIFVRPDGASSAVRAAVVVP